MRQDGETALSIARHVGFAPVCERLDHVTSVHPAVTSGGERQYSTVFPEIMYELAVDSDDEGTGMLTSHASLGRRLPQRYIRKHVFSSRPKTFKNAPHPLPLLFFKPLPLSPPSVTVKTSPVLPCLQAGKFNRMQ